MHYVIAIPEDENEAYLSDSPTDATGGWTESCNLGQRISGKVPLLSATTDDGYGAALHDALPNQSQELIISQKFLDVLMSLGLKNIQAFPVTIINHETGDPFKFYLCNITGTVSCLDRKKAEVEQDGEFMTIYRLAIDEKAIEGFNKKLDTEHRLKLFRLEEDPTYLLADEEIAKAVKQADLEGVEIRRPADCGDFL